MGAGPALQQTPAPQHTCGLADNQAHWASRSWLACAAGRCLHASAIWVLLPSCSKHAIFALLRTELSAQQLLFWADCASKGAHCATIDLQLSALMTRYLPCLQSRLLSISLHSPCHNTYGVQQVHDAPLMIHDTRYSHVQLRDQSSTDFLKIVVMSTSLGHLAWYDLPGANAGPAHDAAVSHETSMPVRNTLAELHCCMRKTRKRARHR
jgi:hypothetical protein